MKGKTETQVSDQRNSINNLQKGQKMGLAAGQARLLSITGRKSDCEFESMRLSHQKIALARELADLSNEYQNSLNQTKLVYDYYGTGDTSTQLSYGILMNPSALNNYMPTLVTDPLGRAVLNSKYAAAAKAAGIPQEGLGSLPSEDTRNAFVQALAKQGLITEKLATTITGLPYNQATGLGGGTTVAANTTSGNVNEFLDFLNNSGATVDITLNGSMVHGTNGNMQLITSDEKKNINIDSGSSSSTSSFNLGDLISGSVTAELYTYQKKGKNPDADMATAAQDLLKDILEQAGEYLSTYLDLGDGYSDKALEYAMTQVIDLYMPQDKNGNYNTDFATNGDLFNNVNNKNASSYIGWTSNHYKGGSFGWGHNRNQSRVSIGNMLNAYLTYFADFMNGVSKTDSNGNEIFDVNKGQKAGSHLATNNQTFQYTWKTGTEVSSDDLGQATFYDALFNQICLNGWTKNDNVTNNEYLQQMLQSGMMFISKMKDDNYYYQGNYATDTYIKEIADETKVAYAESKYNTEKAKLNAKEETLDLKMKNLDTEISSLTTEYDTVKNTISKNIEKSFKRYSA